MDHDITAAGRYVRTRYPDIHIAAPTRVARGCYRVTWTPGGEAQIIPANSVLVVWAILRQQIEHDEIAGVAK